MNHRSARPLLRLRVEVLEDRTVPTIVWTNRLTATDTFTPAERAVVDQAITIWNGIVTNLHNGSNVLRVTITGGSQSGLDLGPGTLGETEVNVGNYQPTSASIRIAANTAIGWYVDPTPADDSEFTQPTASPYAADGGPNGSDLLSTVLHELGHALGINGANARFTSHETPGPGQDFTYHGSSGVAAELAPDEGHLASSAQPLDLMTPEVRDGRRLLPSLLDVQLLVDAYGYTVNLPPQVSAAHSAPIVPVTPPTEPTVPLLPTTPDPTTPATPIDLVPVDTSSSGTDLTGNGPATNLTGQLSVRFGKHRQKGAKLSVTVTLTNTTGQPIDGPFALVLAGLGKKAKLVNATDVSTTVVPGKPWVELDPGGDTSTLNPGQTVSMSLVISNPKHAHVNLASLVFAEDGDV
jgi:hypothetical protein